MGRVLDCAVYADGRRIAEIPLEDISEVLEQDDERFVWIDLEEPDEPLLRKVQAEFSLHDLAVEDALRAHERPKLEWYDRDLFVVLRTASIDPEAHRLDVGEIHVFVGPRYVVSVHHRSRLSSAAVRARCEASAILLAQGPGFALYALMDFMVDQYLPVVEALEDDLEALEAEIFGDAAVATRRTFGRGTTARIYQLKRDVVDFKRAVSPLVAICNQLMRVDVALIPEAIRPYFRDVYDHVVRVNEMIDTVRELLGTAVEANLALGVVAQSDVVKRLTGWAAIVAVPTMIASIYGMNFHQMPGLDWRLGYPVTLSIMLVACGFLYYRFKRAGWL